MERILWLNFSLRCRSLGTNGGGSIGSNSDAKLTYLPCLRLRRRWRGMGGAQLTTALATQLSSDECLCLRECLLRL